MNREIKFRIWADNKFYNKCLVGNTNNTNDEKWTCPMVWLEKQKEWVHCDNGIICQYTGLHDKNGKEIYEGDIIRIKNSLIEIEGEVIFDTIDLSFEVYDKENDCKEMLLYVNEEFEVIGNVFEKGILLNDGKKSKKN